MQKLPAKERNKIVIEEELRRKQDLAETKKTLWKLRSRENKMKRKSEKVQRLENIDKLEGKLEAIETILEELRNEKLKFEEEKKLRKEK